MRSGWLAWTAFDFWERSSLLRVGLDLRCLFAYTRSVRGLANFF